MHTKSLTNDGYFSLWHPCLRALLAPIHQFCKVSASLDYVTFSWIITSLLDYRLVDSGHIPVSPEVAQYMCELNRIAFHHIPFLPQHLELSSYFSQSTSSILSVCV